MGAPARNGTLGHPTDTPALWHRCPPPLSRHVRLSPPSSLLVPRPRYLFPRPRCSFPRNGCPFPCPGAPVTKLEHQKGLFRARTCQNQGLEHQKRLFRARTCRNQGLEHQRGLFRARTPPNHPLVDQRGPCNSVCSALGGRFSVHTAAAGYKVRLIDPSPRAG